jgi:hypothetical protein
MQRRIVFSIVIGAILTVPATLYGDSYTLNAWNKIVLPDTWTLDSAGLKASLTLDFSHVPVGWNVFQVGLAAAGSTNYDTGVWLQVRPAGSANSTVGGYEVFDMQDHALLQRRVDPASGWPTTDEKAYDATNPDNPAISAPFGTYKNLGFYYDRGPVTDPVQQGLFGWADGGNYNTGGIYDIELLFKQVTVTQGVVFVTINGIEQGIYSGTSPNYANEPDYYPAGLSFSTADFGGSFSNLKFWFGQAGAGSNGYSTVYDVSVAPVPVPGAVLLGMLGLSVAGVKLRRRA